MAPVPSSLAVDAEDVRLQVYRSFVETGRAPADEELAARLGLGMDRVRACLADLHERRHLVRGADGGIVMAHPFSAIPLGFSVMGRSTLWWGGCAWDAFAMPHVLPDEPEVLVSTRCPSCGAPHAWVVDRDGPPQGDQVAHFLVPAERMWDDVVHTCEHQRLFCNMACVERWLDDSRNERGDIIDLRTLWRLAAHWYDGRLERGYQRRDPVAAAEYFRSVGLAGPFWGV